MGKYFKKFLAIYVTILVSFMLAFLIYVAHSLIKYENYQIENFIENTIENLKEASKDKKIKDYIDISKITRGEYEKSDISIDDAFNNIFSTQEITYKLSENSKEELLPIYDIFADGQKFIEIKLDGTKKENRMALLTLNLWEIREINPTHESGLFTYNIMVPNNHTVYINDKILSKEQIKEEKRNEGLTQISKYFEIPYMVKYEVTGLLTKPNVMIYDEKGVQISYKQEGNTITKDLNFVSVETEEEAKQYIEGSIDILQVAKDWSLFLTNDLQGARNGYVTIKKYLIEDSDIDNSAYKWATGEDIQFVSKHILLNPTFTNVKIGQFEIYSENAFSCEVYLQKNLKLTSKNQKIEDKMHERMYFVCYDGEWKLVNMQSVTDKE